jgi:hypothetical protein
MSDAGEHKRWLRDTTHVLLTRFALWRRWVKIGLVISGALIAGAAGIAVNLVDPANKWPLYIFQILGLLMVFAGGVVMEFLDEGAADAIRRANELADSVEQRDNDIVSLAGDFEWFTRLYAIGAALLDVVERVIASGPGTAIDQKRRLAAMLDVLVSDKAVLFGMDSDRWNFAIYLPTPGGSLECIACRRPRSGPKKKRRTAPGGRGKDTWGSRFKPSGKSWPATLPSRKLRLYSMRPTRFYATTTGSDTARLPLSDPPRRRTTPRDSRGNQRCCATFPAAPARGGRGAGPGRTVTY